jgi:hypothetical protein
LFPQSKIQCFLENEDGVSLFVLENERGFIQLESCAQFPPVTDTFLLEVETGDGTMLLENGGGSIELEIGP